MQGSGLAAVRHTLLRTAADELRADPAEQTEEECDQRDSLHGFALRLAKRVYGRARITSHVAPGDEEGSGRPSRAAADPETRVLLLFDYRRAAARAYADRIVGADLGLLDAVLRFFTRLERKRADLCHHFPVRRPGGRDRAVMRSRIGRNVVFVSHGS